MSVAATGIQAALLCNKILFLIWIPLTFFGILLKGFLFPFASVVRFFLELSLGLPFALIIESISMRCTDRASKLIERDAAIVAFASGLLLLGCYIYYTAFQSYVFIADLVVGILMVIAKGIQVVLLPVVLYTA